MCWEQLNSGCRYGLRPIIDGPGQPQLRNVWNNNFALCIQYFIESVEGNNNCVISGTTLRILVQQCEGRIVRGVLSGP